MTWTVERNYLLPGDGPDFNAWQFMWKWKECLLACPVPWTLRGYGDGVSVYEKDPATDPWVNVGDLGANGIWLLMENTLGVQVIIQYVSSSNGIMRWSVNGDYTTEGPGPWDDAGHSTVPGNSNPPTDEVRHDSSRITQWNPLYAHIAVSNDGHNFIVSMTQASEARNAIILCRVDAAKPGDTHPWWGYFSGSTSSRWTRAGMEGTGARGYHPTLGDTRYRLGGIRIDTTFIDNEAWVDPFTGNHQLYEPIVSCTDASGRHLRGKMSHILRVPGPHEIGDSYNNGEYMAMSDDYCMPWGGSSESLLW